MPAATILIKPVSSNCNLNCKYCFYKILSCHREKYSMGFMTDQVLEKLVMHAIMYADGILTFAFQGGEPTLAGMGFFQKALKLQQEYKKKLGKTELQIRNTIQTNGQVIDKKWAEFFRENHFLVGLSLDGPRKIHDAARVDLKNGGSFEKVMQTAELFEQTGVEFNILSVITELSVQKATSLYKFYKRNKFPFIQMIPCMDEMTRPYGKNMQISAKNGELKNYNDAHTQHIFPVSAEHYGIFLCRFFDLWYEDLKKGEYMDIRMFSNLVQMAAGFSAEECGMNGRCSCYFVVEGDGSVYPCDFYCIDEFRLGSLEDSFQELLQSKKAKEFIHSSIELPKECKSCPYLSLCRNGCRRWRMDEAKGKNRLCSAYKIFFEYTWERLQKLAQIFIL